MSLSSELIQILNESHKMVWSRFETVKATSSRYGLDPAKSSKWKSPGEPALAYGAMNWWTCHQISSAISRNVTGIAPDDVLATFYFIHQKPKVEYLNAAGLSVQIELGDMLFIRHHFKASSIVPEGRAFILQAKANSTPTTGGMSSDEVKQLELYQDWSKGFTFPHGEIPAPRTGLKWDFSKGPQAPVGQSGIYGVVLSEAQSVTNLPKFNGSCVWGIGFPLATKHLRKNISVPAKTMNLGDALSNLITGGFGRTWVSNPASGSDHWSEFVNNVLQCADLTAANAGLQRIGKEVPRVQDIVSFAGNIPGLNYLLSGSSLSDGDWSRMFPPSRKNALSLIEKWKKTLSVSDDFNGLPPSSKIDIQLPNSPSGMSFIYIVTFGDNSLGESPN
jgi:hypothetical protein